MTLSRAILSLLLVCASGFAFAAEPKSEPASSNSSLQTTNAQFRSNLEVPRLVPWFTGFERSDYDETYDRLLSGLHNRALLQPGTLSENTCFKLREYKVKRQERFREGESASAGYSTCQWSSKFQVHSAVQTIPESSH